jgi:hypothetical protein
MHNYKGEEDFSKYRDNEIDLNNSDDTTLMMTYSGYSIVDFRDGVFKEIPHIRLKVTTTGAMPDFSGDVNGLIKLFIGFKHSENISDMECEVGVNDVKISNSNMAK